MKNDRGGIMIKHLFLIITISSSLGFGTNNSPKKLTINEIKEISLPPVLYAFNYQQTKNAPKSELKRKTKNGHNHNHNIIKFAKKFIGVKYVWGGQSRKGVDCSGFVKVVYKKTLKINLPRTSFKQFKAGRKVNKNKAKVGDLIFFSDSKRPIGHVGIIIDPKKKLMIHASSGAKRVTITNYNKPYYRKHFKGVRRII